MRRIASVLALAGLLVALSPLAASPASARIARRAVIQCTGCWPGAFDFSPNGRTIAYGERLSGEIRLYSLDTGRNTLWRRVRGLQTCCEQGLLGLAIHPDWPNPRTMFVYVTHAPSDENRILRITKRDDGSFGVRILASIPGATGYHNGGVIHIGPDGLLYAVTGDAHDADRAQDLSDRAGKVLRMTRSGGIPSGDSDRILSYGHRNSYGLAFDPETGSVWQTENGPECNDEVNLIVGGNYGWGPSASCPYTNTSGPDPIHRPEVFFNPVIAPTGAVFCDACRLGRSVHRRLLIGSWNDRRIRKLTLDAARDDVVRRRYLYQNSSGVVGLAAHPITHRVWFSDPNGIYRLVRV
jgi:glucose/arabinose dehydrogenase